MPEVDPQALSAEQWQQVSSTLLYLWLFLIFMGGVASNFLIAHAVIPTMVWTHHLPGKAQAVRPVFYLLTLVALAGVVWAASNIVSESEVLRTIYPKVWI